MPDLYTNKDDCCGCSACLNICPKNAYICLAAF
ncbi:4Fe-4S binding protein [Butyrivibrio sp. TB]